MLVLFIALAGISIGIFSPRLAEAGKVVFKRNVIVRAFYKQTLNGSMSTTTGAFTQSVGGVDDYNNNYNPPTRPADSYSVTWTTCAEGNNYCGTGTTTADMKDTSTGLIWSKWLAVGATQTWFWANNCYDPGTAENPGSCVANGNPACQCVKKTSSLTGCEAIGAGWRLPHQKELMQVYIDGSWGNLSNPGYVFWAATTQSDVTRSAWAVYLNHGNTSNGTKTGSASVRVRCVR